MDTWAGGGQGVSHTHSWARLSHGTGQQGRRWECLVELTRLAGVERARTSQMLHPTTLGPGGHR